LAEAESMMPNGVLLGLWTQIGCLMLLRCHRFFRCCYPWRAPMVAGDDADFLLLCFVNHSLQTPVFWRGNVLSYCRFDVGLHEAMMSLGPGKLKDEVICTLARQLREVAAMAGVLRFATLLSLIYVGVLSLSAQRRSSRLWQWDQVHEYV
ncbi:hypothetical protein Tco_0831832, partial [Tanacetum coccineum]